MDFTASTRIEHNADDIIALMMDRMEEIVPFLPSVDAIETLERETLPDGRVRIVRKWDGNSKGAPKVVRPFASKEVTSWHDIAVWTPSEYKIEWEFSNKYSRFYECSGLTWYRPHPEAPETATELLIEGKLTIEPTKLPGIPTFLGKRLAPQIEKFVVRMVKPNITNVADGLAGYFGQWAGEGGVPEASPGPDVDTSGTGESK